MGREHKTARDAFAAGRERARKALASLDDAIRTLESGAACNPEDWGYAGSMGHIAETVEGLNRGFEEFAGAQERDKRRVYRRIVEACGGDTDAADGLIAEFAEGTPAIEDLVDVAEHAEEVAREIEENEREEATAEAVRAERKAGWNPHA